ncbi:hypothetical protein [Sorangium sp. So ce542]|uniref:hypothetical protein n=1 Tax=Sorangium sp. So ce542 TaxID=3133316 RepID=UPI003F602A11
MRDDGLGNNRSLEKLPNQGLLLTARYARGSRGPGRSAPESVADGCCRPTSDAGRERRGAKYVVADVTAPRHEVAGRRRSW